MSYELEVITKAKKDLEQTVVNQIEINSIDVNEIAINSTKNQRKKEEIERQVSVELSEIKEKELYEISLSMLRENPEVTDRELNYSMAKKINESTKSKFLKKASETIMKKNRKKGK